MRPSATTHAVLYRPPRRRTGIPTLTAMPAVLGTIAISIAHARSATSGPRNASSHPYPVVQSSGNTRSRTPASLAWSIAASMRRWLPTQSRGVWLSDALATLMGIMLISSTSERLPTVEPIDYSAEYAYDDFTKYQLLPERVMYGIPSKPSNPWKSIRF